MCGGAGVGIVVRNIKVREKSSIEELEMEGTGLEAGGSHSR